MRSSAAFVALFVLAAWPATGGAQTAPFAGAEVLTVTSSYQEGCFHPCLCALGPEIPLWGTLTLTPKESDPLFTTYAVGDVQWRFVANGVETAVTGSGTYRVGGEVAVTEQLTLDLRFGDGSAVRLDSGQVPGGASFPLLDLTASEHGLYCYDRVVRLHARPVPRLPQTAFFALQARSSVQLSLFTGGTSSPLQGTLRLLLGDPAAPGPLPAGVVGVAVTDADFAAGALAPELPGLGRSLRLVLDRTVRSLGTWDLGTGEVALDLHLTGPEAHLPVPMPLHLRGRLDSSALSLDGDNGGVVDGAIAVHVQALRVNPRGAEGSPPTSAQ